ncbi:DUF6223 family protein [Cryptosporangium arvum]|uniref:DUF6223 family protein n=1 Tax=Cryptosporangium arvum TaxID=80871 RepID=UPI0004B70400|nr:DUF6223 family protein [Cryptosporangium arvum]
MVLESTVYSLTTGRLVASTAAVIALAGVVLGGVALARAGRRASAAALATGGAGALAGAFVVATADGGPGSGSGIVGGFVALVLGLTAALLGGLARRRTRTCAVDEQPG